MIDNIDTNRIQDILGKAPLRQHDPAKTPPGGDSDVSLQVNYTYFIGKATQIPQTDNDAVQKARELLLSGQLENAANIRVAAENIVRFGI